VKPIGLLGEAGYWDALLAWVATAEREGFVRPEHAAILTLDEDLDGLLRRFERWTPPDDRWAARGGA
jgi:hypothetical protein